VGDLTSGVLLKECKEALKIKKGKLFIRIAPVKYTQDAHCERYESSRDFGGAETESP